MATPDTLTSEQLDRAAPALLKLLLQTGDKGYGDSIDAFDPEPSADNNWLRQDDGSFAGVFVDEQPNGTTKRVRFLITKGADGWETETELEQTTIDQSESYDYRAIVDSVLNWKGLSFGVQNPIGSVRFPRTSYARKLRCGYGHLRGFQEDGRSLKGFIHPDLIGGGTEGKLYLLLQDDRETAQTKFMVGWGSKEDAIAAYSREMPPDYLMDIWEATPRHLAEFKRSDFAEEVAEYADLFDFAAKKGSGDKPNCNPAKSHFCRSPNGKGACVSLSKKCKYKPEGDVKQAADYVATKAKKKPTAKPKTEATTEPQFSPTHPDFAPLFAMANGTGPSKIQLSQEQVNAAKNFMGDKYKGTDKQKQIRSEGKTTADESQALSHWLGTSYPTMSKRIWNSQPGDDPKGSILASNILATKALHKLPPATADQIRKGAEAKGHYNYDPDKPLNRWMRIPEGNVEAFVEKYKKAEGGIIQEDNFFGTSHLSASQMGGFSTAANVIYRVKAKTDGTGQGRYVDHFKKSMDEGEILFPPYSKFKVNKVEVPVKKVPKLTDDEKKGADFHDKYSHLVYNAEALSALFGPSAIISELENQFAIKKINPPSNWKELYKTGKKAKKKQLAATSPPYIIELEEI